MWISIYLLWQMFCKLKTFIGWQLDAMVDGFFGFPWSMLQKSYQSSSGILYLTLNNFLEQGNEMVIVQHIAIKRLHIYLWCCLQFQKLAQCFRYILRIFLAYSSSMFNFFSWILADCLFLKNSASAKSSAILSFSCKSLLPFDDLLEDELDDNFLLEECVEVTLLSLDDNRSSLSCSAYLI